MAVIDNDENRAVKSLVLLFALLVKKAQVDEALDLGKIITSSGNQKLFGKIDLAILDSTTDAALLEANLLLLMLKNLFLQQELEYHERSAIGATVSVAKAKGYGRVALRSLEHAVKFLRVNNDIDKSWKNTERLIWALVQKHHLITEIGLPDVGLIAIREAWDLFEKYHEKKAMIFWSPVIAESLAYSELKNGNLAEAIRARKILYNIELANKFSNSDRFQATASLIGFLFKCEAYQEVIANVIQLQALSNSSDVREQTGSSLYLFSCLIFGARSAQKLDKDIRGSDFSKTAVKVGRKNRIEVKNPYTAFDLAEAMVLDIEFRLKLDENIEITELSEIIELVNESQSSKGGDADKLREEINSLTIRISV